MAIGEDDTCENKDCRVGAGRKAMAIGEDDTCENKDCRVSAGRKATTVGENGTCENKDCRVGAGRKASAVEKDNACENKEKRRKMMVAKATSPSSLDCPKLSILIEPFFIPLSSSSWMWSSLGSWSLLPWMARTCSTSMLIGWLARPHSRTITAGTARRPPLAPLSEWILLIGNSFRGSRKYCDSSHTFKMNVLFWTRGTF
uniref:Uncharacterized protein n=1 Tax=Oryza glumipatula TaxID=40148 RepID=A0A0D9YBU2_9ORYZ